MSDPPSCNSSIGIERYYKNPTDTSEAPTLKTDVPGLMFLSVCFLMFVIFAFIYKNALLYGLTGVCLLSLAFGIFQYVTGSSAIKKAVQAGRPCKNSMGATLN